MLNLNQLRAFYHTAQSLSFTIAARNLYVGQPAVTAQVKQFENLCRFKLFRRKGRRMELTDDAKILLRHASKIFELERELELTIDNLRKTKQGYLRISTTRTYGREIMPLLLVPFHKAFSGITIALDEGNPSETFESLVDFRSALAIIWKYEENAKIQCIPFMQEEVLLMVSPKHHLAEKESINIEELTGQPVILLESGSAVRKLVEGWFREAKQDLNIIAETGSIEVIKELVRQGEGISFLLRTGVQREIDEGILIGLHVRNRKAVFDLCICHLRDYELPSTARVFLQFVQSLIQKKKPFSGIHALIAALSNTRKRPKESSA